MKRMLIFLVVLLLLGCDTTRKAINFAERTSVSGKVLRTGVIECFEEGLRYEAGVPVYCEASAVLKRGDELLIGIDKPMPDKPSSVFSLPVSAIGAKEISKEQLQYISSEPFKNVSKIEAFANAGDSLFFCSTAFDRIRDTPEWDSYNSLLAWQSEDYSDVRYVLPEQNGNVMSSKLVRFSLQKALANEQFPGGPPYFKVEALAVLPGNRLIFGVREMGESYQNYDYTFTLVETTFRRSAFGLMPDANFKKVYEFEPAINGLKLGISDLTYQAASNSLIALTSFEGTGAEQTRQMASFLWILPMHRLDDNTTPMPVMADGEPLQIPYKGEGIIMLDNRTIFILHDEDRKESYVDLGDQTITKKPNQAVFSIVKLR